jgi:transposase
LSAVRDTTATDNTNTDVVVELKSMLLELRASVDKLTSERDEYKKLYQQMMEQCRKLERGIIGQQRERFLNTNPSQLSMSVLEGLLGPSHPILKAVVTTTVPEHERKRPTGRKPLPDTLPRVDIDVLPDEVQRAGLDAFECIGDDVTETVEKRPSSLVVVCVHKRKFKSKGAAGKVSILQASPPELPIERCLVGPNFLADTIVNRWDYHQPLFRLERRYGREGLELSRSTICGWHEKLSVLVNPLLEAMWEDAFKSAYLNVDATGVMVQAKDKCRRGHFWVVAAPERHILFGYSKSHDSAAIDELLKGYKGYLVADAHAVFDHLFKTGDIIESGCWCHARRYFCKALESDGERARHALTLIGVLFQVEREHVKSAPEKRLEARRATSKPVLEAFFEWCDDNVSRVLDLTPISKAIGYVRNQRVALERFLDDGRLPIHNNLSERELRREAIGRRNWTFLGNDDAGEVNATFVSLLASCKLHDIEPGGYLRDLFCLLPGWNQKRVLALSPLHWKKTLEQSETQQRLAANVYRQVSLGAPVAHC